jgi:small-conductance mechanosensitive channel
MWFNPPDSPLYYPFWFWISMHSSSRYFSVVDSGVSKTCNVYEENVTELTEKKRFYDISLQADAKHSDKSWFKHLLRFGYKRRLLHIWGNSNILFTHTHFWDAYGVTPPCFLSIFICYCVHCRFCSSNDDKI